MQGDNNEECQLCDEVLEKTIGICGLYGGICPTCLIICVTSGGALAFGRCVEDWCPQDDPAHSPNTN